MSDDRQVYKDVEFTLTPLTPGEAAARYPGYALPTSPNTTSYVVAECETAKGPFVCFLPIDAHVAMFEPDLAQKLVEAAYTELARLWEAEGYDRA